MKLNKQQGFTLIEIAIVFVIIAVLLSYTFMPLRAQLETANIKNARAKLVEIEEALYGYAIANNRLPCPTIPGGNGVSNPDDPAANCANDPAIGGFIGFVPSNTLGIKGDVNCDGLLVDPWGRPYRYSVVNTDGGVTAGDGDGIADFVVTGGIRSQAVSTGNPVLTGPTAVRPNIVVCNNLEVNCTNAVASTTTAVAVIYAMGTKQRANSATENQNAGEGGTVPSTCGLPAYPVANNILYYSAKRKEVAGSEFDDILIWISPNILYSRLLQAGHTLQQ